MLLFVKLKRLGIKLDYELDLPGIGFPIPVRPRTRYSERLMVFKRPIFGKVFTIFGSSNSGQVEFWGPYKILLIGNATVGKSSLLRRFVEGKYASDYYSATVGIDYKRKVVKLTEKAAVKLQIWDTAGQVGSQYIDILYFLYAKLL